MTRSSKDFDENKESREEVSEVKEPAEAPANKNAEYDNVQLNVRQQQQLHEAIDTLQWQMVSTSRLILEDILKKLKVIEKQASLNQKQQKSGPQVDAEKQLANILENHPNLMEINITQLRMRREDILDHRGLFEKLLKDVQSEKSNDSLPFLDKVKELIGINLWSQYEAIMKLDEIISIDPGKKPKSVSARLKAVDNFAVQYGEFEQQGVFQKDSTGWKIAKAVAHFFATLFSAGIYAGASAGYSKVFGTGSLQFWKSKEDHMSEKLHHAKETKKHLIEASKPKINK